MRSSTARSIDEMLHSRENGFEYQVEPREQLGGIHSDFARLRNEMISRSIYPTLKDNGHTWAWEDSHGQSRGVLDALAKIRDNYERGETQIL